MKLYIKNMVCNRCKMVVRSELVKMGFDPTDVALGEITFKDDVNEVDKKRIDQALRMVGFSIIDDKKSRIIERVKNIIVELVHERNSSIKTNLSDLLSEQLELDYNYISHLFAEVEGTTIEKYFIAQKIERVKELLVYDELSLSEIAYQLNYSSVAHLSSQFKKVTDLTPSHFKNIQSIKRKPLDEV